MSARVPSGTVMPIFSAMSRADLAHERGVGQPLRRDERRRELVHLLRVQEVARPRPGTAGAPLRPPARPRRPSSATSTARRCRTSCRARCRARRQRQVRAALDVARRVARPDAVGRLARAVGRTHETHAAGREDHRHVAMTHQLLRALERDRRHPADAARGRTGRRGGLAHDLGDARDAPRRRRMRAEHDGAARLERDQDLVDGRGRRVGGRHDGGHDAEGLGDLDDLLVLDPVDDADGAHRPDELEHALRGEQVLLDLVGFDAVAGFLDGHLRQRTGVRRDGRRPSRSRWRRCAPATARRAAAGPAWRPGPARVRWRWRRGRCRRRPTNPWRPSERGAAAVAGEAHAFQASLVTAWEEPLHFRVRPRDHVDRDQLADAAGRGGAGVGGRLHGADIAAHQHRYIPRADVFLADERDVGGLDHRVGGFHRSDQPARLDHAQRFRRHRVRTVAELHSIIPAMRRLTRTAIVAWRVRRGRGVRAPRGHGAAGRVDRRLAERAARRGGRLRSPSPTRSPSRPAPPRCPPISGCSSTRSTTRTSCCWTDDHAPPTPTQDWRPGTPVTYTRTMFVPRNTAAGPRAVRGRASSRDRRVDRLPLAGQDRGMRVYEVASVMVAAPTNPVVARDGLVRRRDGRGAGPGVALVAPGRPPLVPPTRRRRSPYIYRWTNQSPPFQRLKRWKFEAPRACWRPSPCRPGATQVVRRCRSRRSSWARRNASDVTVEVEPTFVPGGHAAAEEQRHPGAGHPAAQRLRRGEQEMRRRGPDGP